jgi:antitoxin MazE
MKLQKWGNGVGLRSAKSLLAKHGFGAGTDIDVCVENGGLVIRAVRHRTTLDELRDQCRPENRPEPVDWGPNVGREFL